MTFVKICSQLRSISQSPLPEAVCELEQQLADEYTHIFNSVTRTEKDTINACRQRAIAASKKLSTPGNHKKEPSDLRTIAITNLVEIRERQLIFRLFEGQDAKGDLLKFRQLVYDCKDPDAVRVALAHKDALIYPYQRQRLVYFLQQIAPQDRQQVAGNIVPLLCATKQPHHVDPLLNMVSEIPQADRTAFLQALSRFFPYLPSEDWRHLPKVLQETPANLRGVCIERTASLFHAEMLQNPKGAINALEAVCRLREQALVVDLCIPLTHHALDGEYIASILRHVDEEMPPQERQEVIERVVRLMVDATAGQVMYMTLEKLSNLSLLGRDYVEREIEALLGPYTRSDANRVVRILQEIGAPPSDADIQRYDEFIPEDNIDAYRMTLARSDLYENPFQRLFNLVELMEKGESSMLHIAYLGEKGEDDGGLSEDFITILVAQVCEKLKLTRRTENGLYRPNKAILDKNEQKALEALGTLFRFLLNARKQFVIGQLFDMSTFQALRHLTSAHMEASFADAFDELFAIYEKMVGQDDQGKREIEWLKKDSEEALDRIQGFLVPCMAIKKGMLDSPFTKITEESMDAEDLALRLQGCLTNSFVASQIRFEPNVLEPKRTWVLNWILQLDKKKMQSFLSALTGGTSLGQIELKVQTTAGNLKFDSCKHTLSIPSLINSEELLYKLLEGDILTFPDV